MMKRKLCREAIWGFLDLREFVVCSHWYFGTHSASYSGTGTSDLQNVLCNDHGYNNRNSRDIKIMVELEILHSAKLQAPYIDNSSR